MSSIFFKRLKDKYGDENITGGKYQLVINDILAHNNEKAGRAINRLSNIHYNKQLKKLSKKKAAIVKLPQLDEVLPKRSVFIIKGQQNSKLISDTLRDKLQRDLRNTLKEFDGTGKKRMEIQRGITTGKLNVELIKVFQERIKKTFDTYTKADKTTGVPPQVRNIAVTEIRSTIDAIKAEYQDQLLAKNPQLEMTKTWIHNRRLSKEPRKPHQALHLKTIKMNEQFRVGRPDGKGFDLMDRTHDPEAPANQNIGCSCETIYKAKIKDI